MPEGPGRHEKGPEGAGQERVARRTLGWFAWSRTVGATVSSGLAPRIALTRRARNGNIFLIHFSDWAKHIKHS